MQKFSRLCHNIEVLKLTRLNSQTVLVNPDLIQAVESAPDTILLFTNGDRLLVRESAMEIQKLWLQYKANLFVTERKDDACLG